MDDVDLPDLDNFNNDTPVEKQLVVEIQQLLFKYNVFKNYFELNYFLEKYIKNNGNLKELPNVDVCFYLGLLAHDKNTHCKKIFDRICEVIKNKQFLNINIIKWNIPNNEVVIYLEES
jgi:hypothetical protein